MFSLLTNQVADRFARCRSASLVVYVVVVSFIVAACGSANDSRDNGEANGSKVVVDGGSYTNISPVILSGMFASDNFTFVNVHIPYEGEIEDTDLFIPFETIEQNLEQFPGDKGAKIVLYCRTGRMSDVAARTLVKLGYTNVWNLDGGMLAWEQAGYQLFQGSP